MIVLKVNVYFFGGILPPFIRVLCVYCCLTLWTMSIFAMYLPKVPDEKNTPTAFSKTDINHLKQKFLSSFGLTRVPDMKCVNTSTVAMQHALEIYRRSVEESNTEYERNGTENTSELPESSFQRFYSYSNSEPKGFHLPSKDYLHFPVDITASSADNAKLVLKSARLRIFKTVNRDTGIANAEKRGKTITTFLYQLMEPANSKRNDRLLLEIRQSATHLEEWEEFDVSKCVSTWLEKPMTNFGFQLECKGCQENGIDFVTSTRKYNPAKVIFNNNMENQATLDIMVTETSARSKRSKALANKDSSTTLPFDCTQGRKTHICCRHHMLVNFTELGWDWIIQPTSFHAYFCQGNCPLEHKNYGSTHALIQAIFSDLSGGKVPSPCCVPKRMKPLNLLHFNDKDPPQLVVTRQERMIVQDCACS